MHQMIAVSEAKDLVRSHVPPLRNANLTLDEAAGKILAVDITAPVSIPSYPQSSMDGYAFSAEGWARSGRLRIARVVAAGSSEVFELKPDEAVRIFTGAAVPSGADTVVMQEQALISEGFLVSVGKSPLEKGANVRSVGAEIAKDSLAFRKGCLLTPGAIGFLAGMGIANVKVIPSPMVAIIVTGNELLDVGAPLHYGMVYDSNSHSLTAALRQCGISKIHVYHVHDSKEQLEATVRNAINEHDMVLLTGGVSVGDYDHVVHAVTSAGVEKVFHKVRQKPGKPIFFGMHSLKPVFGLPGNPASVLTCFYEYVTIALSRLSGISCEPKTVQVTLSGHYRKPAGITHFLKGICADGAVHLPEGQESYKMNSFSNANCLVMIPEDVSEASEGHAVEIHQFTDRF